MNRSTCKNACPLCRRDDAIWIQLEHEICVQLDSTNEICLRYEDTPSHLRIVYIIFCIFCMGLVLRSSHD
jgi:hypothetical protein